MVAGLALGAGRAGPPGEAPRTPDPRVARVVEVVDGDTLRLRFVSGTERTVRLIGIDAPDTPATGEPLACFGKQASAAAARLAGVGDGVRLEYDARRTDDAGALQAYVFRVSDGVLVNLELLRGGHATVLTQPPNLRHVDAMISAGRAAREAMRGLWGACRTKGS